MSTITRRSFMRCISLGFAGVALDSVWPHTTEAEALWAKITSIVSDIGTAAKTTKDVVDAIEAVKGLMPQAGSAPQTAPSGVASQHMQPFHAQMPDTYAGGNQWLPGLQNVAAQHGNSWVPSRTQGFLGINLTGIWAHPQMLEDQTYIRQFGPYVNWVAGIGGMPIFLGEGLFDPASNVLYVVGQFMGGIPMEIRAQVFQNWTLQGVMRRLEPVGYAGVPFAMAKIA